MYFNSKVVLTLTKVCMYDQSFQKRRGNLWKPNRSAYSTRRAFQNAEHAHTELNIASLLCASAEHGER